MEGKLEEKMKGSPPGWRQIGQDCILCMGWVWQETVMDLKSLEYVTMGRELGGSML